MPKVGREQSVAAAQARLDHQKLDTADRIYNVSITLEIACALVARVRSLRAANEEHVAVEVQLKSLLESDALWSAGGNPWKASTALGRYRPWTRTVLTG